jgi:hypothetical protein
VNKLFFVNRNVKQTVHFDFLFKKMPRTKRRAEVDEPPPPERPKRQKQGASASSSSAVESTPERPRRQSKRAATEVESPPEASNKRAAAGGGGGGASTVPKTMKEKILAVLALNEEKMLGLASIKKLLVATYDMEANKSFNTQVSKALKALGEEKRDDFGKVGGSYHAGKESAAYKEHKEKREEEKRKAKEEAEHGDDIKCPFCQAWNDMMKSFLGEDSISRGGVFRCDQCEKKFYTWISDGYKVGHEIEYKFSKDF